MGLKIDLPEPELDSSSPAKLGLSIQRWHERVFAQFLEQVQQLRDPNIEKIAQRLELMEKTASEAHKKSVENYETLTAMQRSKPDVDRNLDLRLLGELMSGMSHEVRHLNFADGDNWHKTTFSSSDANDAVSKRLQFNLLVCGMEDLDGVDEKSVAILNRWRALNDHLAVEHAIRLGIGGRDEQDAYLKRGGVKSLSRWKAYANLSRELQLANANADPNTAAGLEWVPTGVSFQLMPDIWPELGLINQIPSVAMSRSPMLYPVMNPFIEANLLTEALDQIVTNNATIGPKNITTRSVTLQARKLGLVIWHSSEIEEDSIVQWATTVRTSGSFGIEASKENAMLNGQASAISGVYGTFPTSGQTSSTFDTGVAFTGTANAEDARRAWDGLRYAGFLAGLQEDASTGLIADNLANIQGKLGRFGIPEQCFFWTGYMGRARLLTLKDAANTAVILTAEKAGGLPSFRSGVVGKIFGVSDLVTSYYQSEDLSPAGIDIGGGGGKSEIGIANRLRWVLGTVRLTRVEVLRETRGDQDQIGVKFTHRCIAKPTVTPSATDAAVGLVLGV
jgi:hypothetical protein